MDRRRPLIDDDTMTFAIVVNDSSKLHQFFATLDKFGGRTDGRTGKWSKIHRASKGRIYFTVIKAIPSAAAAYRKQINYGGTVFLFLTYKLNHKS